MVCARRLAIYHGSSIGNILPCATNGDTALATAKLHICTCHSLDRFVAAKVTACADQLAAALEQARELSSSLSACIADAKHLAATSNGTAVFKVQNLPTWPAARLTAWVKRQKIDITVRCEPLAPGAKAAVHRCSRARRE